MSTPRRLLCHPLPAAGEVTELDAAATKHAAVLRLGVGDAVILFDGEGGEADAVIEASGERLVCRVGARREVPPRPRVVLVQCMPKGAKLDDIVRATTEIGVSEIRLAHAARAVARPDEARAQKRMERLSKIAREAARQSLRADVPTVTRPAPLLDVAAQAPDGAVKLAFVIGGRGSVEACVDPTRETWLVVGPEGGLSPDEVDALVGLGYRGVGLAGPVLRVETAAPVVVALVAHRLGAL